VFELHELLGVGGMGEVYRARDTRLGRDVAIKILSRAFGDHPARLARLEREARVLASLNHPHIGAIYGLEEADGIKALVLEVVEGEDLAQRIARGPMSLTEALPIARQIADALEAAHEQGIIHRDLKPANIKVRPDGVVKVLDFGLAKAVNGDRSGPNLSQASSLTLDPTGEGIVLGTAAYMSPEQARGKPVNKRTDIWAFGCVLFEMLTGTRAFEGTGMSDTIAAVLRPSPIGRVFDRGRLHRSAGFSRAAWRRTPHDDCATSATRVSSSMRQLTPWRQTPTGRRLSAVRSDSPGWPL
jgi:serine/threonine protein kinase